MARNIPISLPGDMSRAMESAMRVNHAGECAAVIICSGQLDGYSGHNANVTHSVCHTLLQEKEHCEYFCHKIRAMNIKPTALLPIWRVASYILGYASGALGPRGIMACTNAVEREIDKHYCSQLNYLADGELKNQIKRFKDDEVEHMHNAASFLGKTSLINRAGQWFISRGCSLAIEISKRI